MAPDLWCISAICSAEVRFYMLYVTWPWKWTSIDLFCCLEKRYCRSVETPPQSGQLCQIPHKRSIQHNNTIVKCRTRECNLVVNENKVAVVTYEIARDEVARTLTNSLVRPKCCVGLSLTSDRGRKTRNLEWGIAFLGGGWYGRYVLGWCYLRPVPYHQRIIEKARLSLEVQWVSPAPGHGPRKLPPPPSRAPPFPWHP